MIVREVIRICGWLYAEKKYTTDNESNGDFPKLQVKRRFTGEVFFETLSNSDRFAYPFSLSGIIKTKPKKFRVKTTPTIPLPEGDGFSTLQNIQMGED